jgi:hypothetical protein
VPGEDDPNGRERLRQEIRIEKRKFAMQLIAITVSAMALGIAIGRFAWGG